MWFKRICWWLTSAIGVVCGALAMVNASAACFEERVMANELWSAISQGKACEDTLDPYLQKAMQICVPKGSTDPGNLGDFSFVVDVSVGGLQSDLQVRPKTKVSMCFAREFENYRLRRPPGMLDTNATIPLFVEIKVVN